MKTMAAEHANRCANTSRITHKSEFTFLQGGEMLWVKSPSGSFQFINSGPGTIPQRFRGAGFCVPVDVVDTALKTVVSDCISTKKKKHKCL